MLPGFVTKLELSDILSGYLLSPSLLVESKTFSVKKYPNIS